MSSSWQALLTAEPRSSSPPPRGTNLKALSASATCSVRVASALLCCVCCADLCCVMSVLCVPCVLCDMCCALCDVCATGLCAMWLLSVSARFGYGHNATDSRCATRPETTHLPLQHLRLRVELHRLLRLRLRLRLVTVAVHIRIVVRAPVEAEAWQHFCHPRLRSSRLCRPIAAFPPPAPPRALGCAVCSSPPFPVPAPPPPPPPPGPCRHSAARGPH